MAQAHHLSAGGVSVLLVVPEDEPPRVAHWGAALGELDDEQLDQVGSAVRAGHRSRPGAVTFPHDPVGLTVNGWTATPGISGHRDGQDWSPRWTRARIEADDRSVVATVVDEVADLQWTGRWELDDTGTFRVQSAITNLAEAGYSLGGLLTRVPVPQTATELLDLTGRWIHEREPQRHPFVHGSFRREGRHGRTGHDATLLLTAGTPGFGFRQGEVWSAHTAWSGNHVTLAERTADGDSVLGGGELLSPGEIVLQAGETYTAPWIYFVWSDAGLDGVSRRLHQHLRARPGHPSRPRPIVLNTWEAVYFGHDLATLTRLSDTAAEVGVERFVLDDGWFRGRRNDRAGLGDWYVDEDVWPLGLSPIIDHVTGLGMEFGLWVEPEMVNLDSDLARSHPEWVLSYDGRLPGEWRHQQVLDLANPQAFGYLLERLSALLDENDIAFLKWDHNRDLIDVRVHAQTIAVYALLDELRRRYPDVEIESCSSGGARIDLGILDRTDRVWGSDSNDALERQQIQRWTSLLIPLELIGSHVGPRVSHTTGRRHTLAFRAVTALFGHFGIEWDIASAGPEERAELAEWVAIAKRHRRLLHSGELVRIDPVDPGLAVHGVVAPDRSEALFAVVAERARSIEQPALVRFAGLDTARSYRLSITSPATASDAASLADIHLQDDPDDLTREIVLPGSALMAIGWRAPSMAPETALLVHLAPLP